MPRPKWMSDSQFKRYELCLKDLENKKGINKFAVCTASIKNARKKAKEQVYSKLRATDR